MIDDGSGDDTLAYLRSLAHPAVRVLAHESTGNPARLRNLGIEHARGEYLAFLDSDDDWRPDKLERQVAALRAQEADAWSYTAYGWLDARGRDIAPEHVPLAKVASGWILEQVVRHDVTIATPTVMTPRRLLERVGGFDPGLTVCEDYDLWFRIAAHAPAIGDPNPLARIRLQDGKWSFHHPDRFRSWIQICERLAETTDRPEVRAAARRSAAAAALRWAADHRGRREYASSLAKAGEARRYGLTGPALAAAARTVLHAATPHPVLLGLRRWRAAARSGEPVPRDRAGRAVELTDEEVRRHLVAARRSGRPHWLWPDVAPGEWRAALVQIEAVLRADLAGVALTPLSPASDAETRALAVAAFTSGTAPLLGLWAANGRLDAAPALRGVLTLHLEHGRRRWERTLRHAARTVERLAELDLGPILLKGAHTASAFFPEPGCRPSSDVDVAVPSEAWASAVEALERAGYRPEVRQSRLGRAELLPPGEGRSLRSLDLLHSDAPIRIDLHAGLDRVMAGVGRFVVGAPRAGEVIPWPRVHPAARVLAEPLLVATLAVQASEELHRLTLMRAYELARVVRAATACGALDWEALLDRVGSAGFRFLFPSLEIAERLAPGTVPATVRERLGAAAPAALRRVVASLSPAFAQRFAPLPLREQFMWVGSRTELWAKVGDMVWPASAGGSPGRIAEIYAKRVWRLARAHGRLTR